MLRRVAIGQSAEGGHICPAEFAPVRKNRREHGSGFIRSELQKAMTGSAFEGLPQAFRNLRIKRRCIHRRKQNETAVRSQGRSKRG